MTEGLSNRKSLGRLCRSVEMITQRPVTGSLRSSGIKCVLIDFNRRLARVEVNRADVEPAGTTGQMMPHHEVRGEPHHPCSLEGRDRFRRLAEVPAGPRLHLDEHYRRPVA